MSDGANAGAFGRGENVNEMVKPLVTVRSAVFSNEYVNGVNNRSLRH